MTKGNDMARTKLNNTEVAYLESQALGRIATVDPEGRPRVVPTGFAVNAERGTIELGGHDFGSTRRAADIRENPHVALVVDDIADPATWNVRGVDIRGKATLHDGEAPEALPAGFASGGWMEIAISSVRSWGLE